MEGKPPKEAGKEHSEKYTKNLRRAGKREPVDHVCQGKSMVKNTVDSPIKIKAENCPLG